MISKAEKTAIDRLEELSRAWPDSLMLYSCNSSLHVVRKNTMQIVASIDNIHSDGGDPGIRQDDDGYEWIDLPQEGKEWSDE